MKTCAEVIDIEFRKTMQMVKEVWENHLLEEKDEMIIPLCEFVYHVQRNDDGVYWTLAAGGPSEYFKFIDAGRILIDIEYHYQNWFDGASLYVTGDSFTLLKNIWEECLLCEK